MQADWAFIEKHFNSGGETVLFDDSHNDSSLSIECNGDYVCFHAYYSHECGSHVLTRDEAIAAARAILKHFGEE